MTGDILEHLFRSARISALAATLSSDKAGQDDLQLSYLKSRRISSLIHILSSSLKQQVPVPGLADNSIFDVLAFNVFAH